MKRFSALSTSAFICALLTYATFAQTATPAAPQPPESFTAAEFSKLSRELSEPGGYFMSDNFTSNETSYLHIVPKLRELCPTGGAYLGVGPEQNFTYLAKLRPRMVFLLDIRRQAVIQHMMYKALFHLSPTRTAFLARLLSKPLTVESKEPPKADAPKLAAPKADASIHDLLAFFDKIKPTDETYTANLAEIKKTIETEFQFPLSIEDQASLEYVYKNFRVDGLDISFRLDSGWNTYFPTFRELLVQTDLKNQLGNFLAIKEDYDFLRDLHRKNLIIPIVGDFGGKKALVAVGDTLRQYGLTVSAFYLSNVEQYLFDGTSFENFAANVSKLPLTEKSNFIRAVFNMRYTHPAALPGHLSTTLLQPMKLFLQDFDAGRYAGYRDVIMNHYIAPDQK